MRISLLVDEAPTGFVSALGNSIVPVTPHIPLCDVFTPDRPIALREIIAGLRTDSGPFTGSYDSYTRSDDGTLSFGIRMDDPDAFHELVTDAQAMLSALLPGCSFPYRADWPAELVIGTSSGHPARWTWQAGVYGSPVSATRYAVMIDNELKEVI